MPLKGAAYAVSSDGSRTRLTRHQLLTASWPPGTVEVIAGVRGHLSDHDAAHSRELVRLTPTQAQEAASRRTSAPRALAQATSVNEVVFSASGVQQQVSLRVWQVASTPVLFGAPDGARVPGAVHLPRNPYVLAGIDPSIDEGRAVGLSYTAALAAATAAQPCLSCRRLSGHRCGACSWGPDLALVKEARRILGPQPPQDTTVVDALVYAAARGDEAAEVDLRALAALGEQMIAQERRHSAPLVPPAERELALQLDEAAFSRWERDTLDRLVAGPSQRNRAQLDEALAALHRDSDPAARARVEQLQAEGERTFVRARDEVNAIRDARAEGVGRLSLDDLYVVHETGHEVDRDADGNVVLRPAGDHNPGTFRDTIHFCLNGAVTGHLAYANTTEGRWVVAPLRAVLDANPGALEVLNAVDTFFVPPAGRPFVVPAEAATVIEFGGDVTPAAGPDGGDRAARLRHWLAGRGALTFDIGAHHSSPGVDARVSHLAHDVGVPANRLHANLPHGRHEAILNSFRTAEGSLPVPRPTPAVLAQMGDNARVRLVAHDRWGAAEASLVPGDEPMTIG